MKTEFVCKQCKHFLGMGDWGLCCDLKYNLCYEDTPACRKFEAKESDRTMKFVDLKPGDKVMMNDNYRVSDKNKGVIFTVRSDPWDVCGTLTVLLDGYRGRYAVDGLTKIEDTKNNDS